MSYRKFFPENGARDSGQPIGVHAFELVSQGAGLVAFDNSTTRLYTWDSDKVATIKGLQDYSITKDYGALAPWIAGEGAPAGVTENLAGTHGKLFLGRNGAFMLCLENSRAAFMCDGGNYVGGIEDWESALIALSDPPIDEVHLLTLQEHVAARNVRQFFE